MTMEMIFLDEMQHTMPRMNSKISDPVRPIATAYQSLATLLGRDQAGQNKPPMSFRMSCLIEQAGRQFILQHYNGGGWKARHPKQDE